MRELERRLAELDEWDARYGLGGAPPGHPLARDTTPWRYHSPDGSTPITIDSRPARAPRHRRRRRVWPAVLTVLALGGAAVVAVEYPDEARSAGAWALHTGQRVLGTAVDPTPAVARTGPGAVPAPDVVPRPDLAPEPDLERVREAAERHPPGPAPDRWVGWRPATGERILPTVEPGVTGEYAFLGTQPGTDEPVGFSPCGPVEVVVNPAGAPEDYAGLVQGSLDRISTASGLHLVLVGETDELWVDEPREAGLPVLVTWGDVRTIPRLGESAGFAGPSWQTGPDGRWWSASGQVVIDPGLLPTREALAAVLDHELAHVVGLGHVGDPAELMSPVNTGQLAFGPGDLAGLAALGSIACPTV